MVTAMMSSGHTGPKSGDTMTSPELMDGNWKQPTLFAGAFHVKISQWPADVRALLESGRGFGSSSIAFLRSIARLGLSLRTSPACYPRTEGGALPPSSGAGRHW